MKKFAHSKERINSLKIDNDYIYTASKDCINVFSKYNFELLHSINIGEKGAQISIDKDYIYCTGNYHFMVFNKDNYQLIYKEKFGSDISSDLRRPINDGQNIYFPVRNGNLIVVSKNNYNKVQIVKGHKGTIWGMCYDDNFLYTGCVDKLVRIINKDTLKITKELSGHKKNVQRVIANNKYLISAASDHSIIIWNKANGDVIHTLKKVHQRAINGLFIIGNYLISSCQAQNNIIIWDMNNWQKIKELELSIDEGGGLVFDNNNVYIALKNEKCVMVDSVDSIIK